MPNSGSPVLGSRDLIRKETDRAWARAGPHSKGTDGVSHPHMPVLFQEYCKGVGGRRVCMVGASSSLGSGGLP